ncbi:PP2C family protein-serine/threonine phosphatase [Sphaerimonospora cavernae]|uniref:PP2C family protein-serine/threonine phosphatase n=1 Tax=Sphaerimonospora cavernae TaxID=1740611 RepID=A0ABV6UDV9_9ACTN
MADQTACDAEGAVVLADLLRAHPLVPMERMAALAAGHAARLGFSELMIYVADLRHLSFLPLPGQRDPHGELLDPIPIDTTLAGRAFRNVEIVQADPTRVAAEPPQAGVGGPVRLWAPLVDGVERVGVLGVTAPVADEVTERRVTDLALLIALVVAGKRHASDSYKQLVRGHSMRVGAELLWTLMPARTFATDVVAVSAGLEPAYAVGGDAFDYALAGHTLHLSIFDAIGHDTSAGLTSAIALASHRNNRRQGIELLAASDAIDDAIADQFSTSRYATGILADLNIRNGSLTWVNRGHPPPLLLRKGRVAGVLDSTPDPPMGFSLGPAAGLARRRLEPGDRLLLYTDGMTEARSPTGERFGLERFADLVLRGEADGLAGPEIVRRVIHAVMDHQLGGLHDDATMMLVEWRPPGS